MKRILLYVLGSAAVFAMLNIQRPVVEIPDATSAEREVRQERSGPEMIAEIRREMMTPEDLDAPAYEGGYLYRESEKAKARMVSLRSSGRTAMDDLNFVERGPSNVPGRTRGLIVHPSDASGNTWYAAAVGGGIWKTTDAGASWRNLTPEFPNLATTTLAMSTSDMNVMYAGTGEGFFATGMINGIGIFKSTDAGETWTLLESTAGSRNFQNVNRIIVDPTTPDILIACMNNAVLDTRESTIRRSTDGGMTWDIVFEGPSGARVQQIVHDPNDFKIQYATVNGRGVFKSTDAGLTWTQSSQGMAPGGRIEMGISPVNTDRLYASVEGGLSGSNSDLYTSDDAGATWISIKTADTAIDFLGGQGWFDNGLLPHPFEENSVYVCAVNTFRFDLGTDLVTGNEQVTNVDENGTDTFLDVVNFSAPYFRGGLDISDDAANRTYVSVELRFGEGRSQMAHRFLVPEGEGPGVADSDYTYADYVEVPFEAWDIDNNRQLMVSFRDQQRDGGFDLFESSTDGAPSTHSREYVYISQEDYDASGPSSTIAADAGHVASDLYFLWPILREGASSDPSTWPTSELVINWSSVVQLEGTTIVMTDAYNDFDGKNDRFAKHPDQHDLMAIIDDEANEQFRMINSTDGGVFISESGTNPGFDEGSWTFTGNGYNTSQFYGADKAPGEDRFIGGMQDNGTYFTTEGPADATSEYTLAILGDGFEALWHSSDPLKLIGASQFNGHDISLDGGQSWTSSPPTDNGSGNAPFISRTANSKENPDVVFAVGGSGVWRSPDFGATWNSVAITDDWGFGGGSQARVSVSNADIVWAGGVMGEGGKLHVSTDQGLTFSPTQNYDGAILGNISGIGTHPTDDNTAYALFSFAKRPKVLKTTDLGQTWADISGFGMNEESSTGFPDVTVYSILVMPHDTDRIWVGTEIGIVESLDGGVTWALLDGSFPSVAVWQMLIQDGQVVIATHGRGIWTVEIEGLPEVISAPSLREIAESPDEQLNLRANFVNNFDQVEVLIDGSVAATVDNVMAGEQIVNVPSGNGFGTKEIQIRATSGSEVRLSNSIAFDIVDVPDAVSAYENNFRTQSGDFNASSGAFLVNFVVSGFDGGGIHSDHPYTNSVNSTVQLAVPIRVASEDATVVYDDVAIMELGEEGSVFGETAFNDYVVIEGSTDGLNWTPIEDGYDASYDAGWQAVLEQGLTPSSDNMIAHTVNLLNNFSAGDVIFLRFRLFTNDATTAWGWAIDNLKIQAGSVTTGFEEDILNEKQAIRTYPNPVNAQTKIEFYIPNRSNATLEMIDMNGRTVFNDNLGTLDRGLNAIDWQRGNIEQGIYILKLRTIDGVATTRVQLN